jgi:hypothetical protein
MLVKQDGAVHVLGRDVFEQRPNHDASLEHGTRLEREAFSRASRLA